MPRDACAITADDLMPVADYARIRKEKREENVLRKRFRRISVGPYCTVFFENYDTMWMQVQEMLYIEKGGPDQVPDELAAYNPMIPKGRELTATLMFEIDDERLRKSILGRLGGVENHIAIQMGSIRVPALPEMDVDRTTPGGKVSSVLFLHFPFTDAAVAAFRDGDEPAMFVIDHPNYGHAAILGAQVRRELAGDFA